LRFAAAFVDQLQQPRRVVPNSIVGGDVARNSKLLTDRRNRHETSTVAASQGSWRKPAHPP
jgi:hypothetical protein